SRLSAEVKCLTVVGLSICLSQACTRTRHGSEEANIGHRRRSAAVDGAGHLRVGAEPHQFGIRQKAQSIARPAPMTDSQKNRFGPPITRIVDPVSILDEDPISPRDRPLAGCWKLLVPDPERPTGRRGEKEQAATSILYGELLVSYWADPKRWVSYSRRKEF